MTGFERGPLVSEVTALPTEPQPLHIKNFTIRLIGQSYKHLTIINYDSRVAI